MAATLDEQIAQAEADLDRLVREDADATDFNVTAYRARREAVAAARMRLRGLERARAAGRTEPMSD